MSAHSQIRIQSGLAIHGGVGTIPEHQMAPANRKAYEETLGESLRAGQAALDGGGGAVDAVVEAIRVMEDSPLFNAGRGSNFDERGIITMDASLMQGSDRDAGAVAGVADVQNPIQLARLVMERSEHLMLIGEGAEVFARAHGLEPVDPTYLHTTRRWKELEQARAGEHGSRPNVLGEGARPDDSTGRAGTVGAVARDKEGEIAAGTSTGGMANKTWGRVGDSPIIGAGTFAGPLCAVSCTGWGEYFIRSAVAHDVHARMAYGSVSLHDAVHGVIWEALETQVPGAGGLVAIDREGNVELCFSTPGMYRGWVDQNGAETVEIYGGKQRDP